MFHVKQNKSITIKTISLYLVAHMVFLIKITKKSKKFNKKNYKFLLKNCNNYIKKQKEIFVIV